MPTCMPIPQQAHGRCAPRGGVGGTAGNVHLSLRICCYAMQGTPGCMKGYTRNLWRFRRGRSPAAGPVANIFAVRALKLTEVNPGKFTACLLVVVVRLAPL
mmetsp:Transcript_3897/g.13804  ORF Transcript_3897/g.13804 Transcript_3897/m.13804 type:complete len:101 (-) Transcript_3897:410-712(-)